MVGVGSRLPSYKEDETSNRTNTHACSFHDRETTAHDANRGQRWLLIYLSEIEAPQTVGTENTTKLANR